MTTLLGMPFFLADKTGSLYGSDYSDLYGRMALRITRTQQNRQRNAYMIFVVHDAATPPKSFTFPQAALDFGPDHAVGTIAIGTSPHIPMEQYLIKSSFKGASSRKFIASDGQEYWWTWRRVEQEEWTCCNKSGYVIASYNLKVPGEPIYRGTSGCMLTIEEAYPHLAAEILATLIIMRHLTTLKRV